MAGERPALERLMVRLTDDEIDSLSPTERRELILRLERPINDLIRPQTAARVRRVRLGIMVGGSVALIPWIVFLAASLPTQYIAPHWSVTWVGFDVLLVILMATTAYLGWRQRVLFVLTAFATAIMLICDAWFDITTAGSGDVWVAVGTAVFAELPLAALMIFGTIRLIQVMGRRLWLIGPGAGVWHLMLPT